MSGIFHIDRSEGGASIYDGSIEIMVHRRILHDDALGVNEVLNETAYGTGLVVSGKHVVIIDRPSESARLHRVIAQQMFMHPLPTYSMPNVSSFANYAQFYHQNWSALMDLMPLNVHLLTFDQLSTKQYLVRLENYFELNEDQIYSTPATIDLQKLFTTIGTIGNVNELILTANMPLSQLQRLNWMIKDRAPSNDTLTRKSNFTSNYFSYLSEINFSLAMQSSLHVNTISLNPMQIRTFQVTIA